VDCPGAGGRDAGRGDEGRSGAVDRDAGRSDGGCPGAVGRDAAGVDGGAGRKGGGVEMIDDSDGTPPVAKRMLCFLNYLIWEFL